MQITILLSLNNDTVGNPPIITFLIPIVLTLARKCPLENFRVPKTLMQSLHVIAQQSTSKK